MVNHTNMADLASVSLYTLHLRFNKQSKCAPDNDSFRKLPKLQRQYLDISKKILVTRIAQEIQNRLSLSFRRCD